MRLTTIFAALAALTVASGFALAGHGGEHDNNAGTIKLHDEAIADPNERNEPHVACEFWVEGFNMNDASGHLEFYSWPPTGDKSMVVPGGDSLTWTGWTEDDADGNHHLLNGPYYLESGHYRVEAYTDDGHPGHDAHFAKSKMFWVECDETDLPPPAGDTPPPRVGPNEEEEIPFFPSPAVMAVAVAGVAGVALVASRRKL